MKAALRYGIMTKTLGALLFLLISSKTVAGQGWTAYAGAGVGYDAFLRDKTITTHKVGWPFQVGATVLAGISYYTASGFNIFADMNVGLVRIQFPVPEVSKSRNHYELGYTRLMLGSGPRINVGEKGNFVTPFIQLGVMGMSTFGSDGVGDDDQAVRVLLKDNSGLTNSWLVVAGAGIDWQFNAIVPSSVNLQCSFTPLHMFDAPIGYIASTKKGSYDLALQGKLFQLMLSYKVHFWVKRSSE